MHILVLETLVQISHRESQEVLLSAILFINYPKLGGFHRAKPWTVQFLFSCACAI